VNESQKESQWRSHVYFNDHYAVTTDGGQSWTLWNASKNLHVGSGESLFIHDVTVNSEG
jgi:hypothetical protein